MGKKKFLDLVWRSEKILIQADHLRSQVGKCGEQCEGLDGIDAVGLCPSCCEPCQTVIMNHRR